MKKVAIFISMISVLMLIGCANKDDVAQELINYHNDTWVKVQEMKIEGVSVLKEQSFPQNEMLNEASEFDVEEALSTMDQVTDYLANLEPKHKDIRELHNLLVEAEEFATYAIEGQIAYASGELTDKQVEINNKKLMQKYDAFVKYQDELMDTYNVVWGAETDIAGVWLIEKE